MMRISNTHLSIVTIFMFRDARFPRLTHFEVSRRIRTTKPASIRAILWLLQHF
jgi:hypothetical protein